MLPAMNTRVVVAVLVVAAGCGDRGTGSGVPCSDTEPCPAGEFCALDGHCRTDGTCGVPGDCPSGQTCEDGRCQTPPPCDGGGQCDPGHFCSSTGTCIPDGTCAGDPDCAAADFCSVTRTCIPDGTCANDDDCQAGMICNPSSTCEPGGGCGLQELTIDPIPPNMLLVLDRSCSMRNQVAGVSKWQAAVTAIDLLTTNFAGDIRWGLALFPDTVTPNCGQGAIAVPVGPGNETSIQGLLDAALQTTDPNYPDGPCVTNIDTAMQQAAGEPAFDDPTRASYVMLITDGMQAGCSLAGGDAGTTQIITDLHGQRGVDTFVVGFGGGVDGAQLDIFAVAGGQPLPGSPRYYRADNAMELEMQLAAIAGLVIGCQFQITTPPPAGAELYVFFDNTVAVPRDPSHTDGWDYDPITMTLTVYGSYCDQLRSGAVTSVDVVFGCPGPG